MQVVTSVAAVRAAIAVARADDRTIGFVPTMGFLHDGHLALVDAARAEAAFVVMSIFVNPLQFGPTEDLSRYPRDDNGDEAKARSRGVDLLFRPSEADMYSAGRQITVTPGPMAARWEGEIRPGHFAGVLTVVAKLFNIVQPDVAVFGQKDFQQAGLVRAMVRDLDFPLRMLVSPTVREEDNLAMSSRNAYLSAEERVHARALSLALRTIQERFAAGETDANSLVAVGQNVVANEGGVDLDYLAVIDADSLEPVDVARTGNAVIIAAKVGHTRLLDNTVLGATEPWLQASS